MENTNSSRTDSSVKDEKRKTVLQFHQLAAHRREFYKLGEIPNRKRDRNIADPRSYSSAAQ